MEMDERVSLRQKDHDRECVDEFLSLGDMICGAGVIPAQLSELEVVRGYSWRF